MILNPDKSFNYDKLHMGVVTTTNDAPPNGLGQRRIGFSIGPTSAIPATQTLWARATGNWPFAGSAQQGSPGLINSPHGHLEGTVCIFEAPTTGQGEWICHGTIANVLGFNPNSGQTGNPQAYQLSGDPAFQYPTPTLGQTTVADQPGQQSYTNPVPPQTTSDAQQVAQRRQNNIQHSQFAQAAQQLFTTAQNIVRAGVNVNSITKLIQQFDPQGGAEATQNLNTVKILDQMREQLNQIPGLGSLLSFATNGQMPSLQSMIGSQATQFFTQLISLATQVGANMNNHNNNPATAGTPLTTTFTIDPTTGAIIANGPLAPVTPAPTTPTVTV